MINFIRIFLVAMLMSGIVLADEGSNVEYVILDYQWQLRWGDSPPDSDSGFAWLQEPGSKEWQDITGLRQIKPQRDRRFIWIRHKLPEYHWDFPVLFVPPVMTAFELFLDSQLIYKYGELRPSPRNINAGTIHHEVILNKDYAGKWIYFRIFSDDPGMIAIKDAVHKVIVGERRQIMARLFVRNIDSVIFGFLYVFVGGFALLLFLRRRAKNQYFYLAFALFTTSVGGWLISGDVIMQPFFSSLLIRSYIQICCMLLFPIGLYSFYEQMIDAGPKKIVRRMWQFHVLYALFSFAAILFYLVMPSVILQLLLILLILGILVIIVIGLRVSCRSKDVNLLNFGFMVVGVAGLHDILMDWQVIPDWHWLFPWGTLVLILVLGYLLERRFMQSHERLEKYSSELEDKSGQLERSNLNLEQRVLERTQELNDKNSKLAETLNELQAAQNQLVLKEKMASLGNLVAGIAHEVNTPIGAVNSAADVSSRCIERIDSVLLSAKETNDLPDNENLIKSMKLLRENNKVTVTASKRIVEIVRSLKNFARLDEADFQNADIHEGLDSTLTLIHHEIKNRITVDKQYGSLPFVQCYPNQLNQVFMNMLVNASQAIEGQGAITIKTSLENEDAVITISDNGKGIAQDKLQVIFDPGFTTKGVGVGTGLGLSISYNIIQKHNGSISVESEVGKGTAFTIRLPVKQEKK